MESVKVVIEVRGGCVVSVMSGIPLDAVVIDHDDFGPFDRPAAFGRMFADDTLVSDFMCASSTKKQI
ncbi:MAG: hypothetical protein WC736_14730 [Gallionella sp.]|jgi:hypothetical protein